MRDLFLVINFLSLSMATEKKQVKITKRDKADKIKESEELLLQIDVKKATKQAELDSIKDQQDPESKKQAKKLEKEIFELDKQTRWNNDRIKMLNNLV